MPGYYQFHVTDLISPIPFLRGWSASGTCHLSGSTTAGNISSKKTDARNSHEQKWKKTMCSKWDEKADTVAQKSKDNVENRW